MKKTSFIKSGDKELAIHGDYLRFKDDESIKDIVINKITSISVENINDQYSKLIWAALGFFTSIISWYLLEESIFSTIISILSLIGAVVFFISYFLLSLYRKFTIKTARIDIFLEFSSLDNYKILEFKKTLLERMNSYNSK